MSDHASAAAPLVGIVGGGLAGLAAAVALRQQGLRVTLLEARRQLGGRATSFRDPATGQLIDHCQHVSLGCCTNLADFCRRTGIAGLFRRDRKLHFFSPEGQQYDFAASRWLPAPLHLLPALLKLRYFSLRERLGIIRAMRAIMKMPAADDADGPTVGDWLRQQQQSAAAIERFWGVVLVSALGETLDRASLSAARKVFVDAFMAHSSAYEVEIPIVPLGELYGTRLEQWLVSSGVDLRLSTPVAGIDGSAAGVRNIVLADGSRLPIDHLVLAVPWRRVGELLGPELRAALPQLAGLEQIEAAPITGVHLWFDRPITALPHAVLVGTLSQWLFNRGTIDAEGHANSGNHYYQVVISASRELAAQERNETIAQIRRELEACFPAARGATLLASRLVTEQNAVFSVRPGLDQLRPHQQTSVPNLMLAGDYTATGWPATMEGAVRSGYLAAEAVLRAVGRPASLLVPDLPRAPFARWLLGRS